jgi:molybdate transport system permease protein
MPSAFLGLTADDWRAVLLSVQVAVCAVALSLPPGLALGWLLARYRFPGKTAVETVLNLPLVLPPVVTGYLLLALLGRRGPVGHWLHESFGVEVAFTWKAAVLAVAVMGFPLLLRSVRLSFEMVDPRLGQAARTLGAGPFTAWRTVSLPLAANGIVAGCVLAFARGLGEFGATVMVAGQSDATRTLALQIYALRDLPGADAEARLWRLTAACVALAFLALAGSEYLNRRGRRRAVA